MASSHIMSIIRVALDVPVNTLFDYLLPEDEVTREDVGARVRVPFGKNTLTGVIMEVIHHSLVPTRRLRVASHVLRDVPPLPKNVLDLFRFCSEYYHHPLGEVVMNGLPTRLRSNKPFIQESHTDFQYRLTPHRAINRSISHSRPKRRQAQALGPPERTGRDQYD